MYQEAFGDNILINKLSEYMQDMDSYARNISQTASFACFIAPFLGVSVGALPLVIAASDNTTARTGHNGI